MVLFTHSTADTDVKTIYFPLNKQTSARLLFMFQNNKCALLPSYFGLVVAVNLVLYVRSQNEALWH